VTAFSPLPAPHSLSISGSLTQSQLQRPLFQIRSQQMFSGWNVVYLLGPPFGLLPHPQLTPNPKAGAISHIKGSWSLPEMGVSFPTQEPPPLKGILRKQPPSSPSDSRIPPVPMSLTILPPLWLCLSVPGTCLPLACPLSSGLSPSFVAYNHSLLSGGVEYCFLTVCKCSFSLQCGLLLLPSQHASVLRAITG
jgi:hypothetical protein